MARLGLIVNPIAGMGGRVGSEGNRRRRRRSNGHVRSAPFPPPPSVRSARSCGSSFGAEVTLSRRARPHGRGCSPREHAFETEAADAGRAGDGGDDGRRHACSGGGARGRGVDLILFAGGDGTARDIHDVVGERVPVLGMPTGVKMHSGVFASTPESAGDVAASSSPRRRAGRSRQAEVLDIDEDAVRAGTISTRLYGAACVPDDAVRVPGAKRSAVPSDEVALDAVCAAVADCARSAPHLRARPGHDDAPRDAAARAAEDAARGGCGARRPPARRRPRRARAARADRRRARDAADRRRRRAGRAASVAATSSSARPSCAASAPRTSR